MKKFNKYLYSNFAIEKVKEKSHEFLSLLVSQIIFHYKNCNKYKNFLNNLNFKFSKMKKVEDLPFLHVNSFKNNDLFSIKKNKIYKILKSSGTTDQYLSKVYLDKFNAKNQIIILKKILSSILGNERLPMLIIEQNPNLKDKSSFGAKIAAIYGFSIFGKNHCFIINEKNKIDYEKLNNFLKLYGDKKFLIFGFTSSIYNFLIKELLTKKISNSFCNGILLHGGGWKKLEKFKISNMQFKKKLLEKIKIKRVINYYGTVEQTGTIFLECEICGCFHTNIFADILIRKPNLDLCKKNEPGIVQLVSILPTSYPGNSILLEDEGYLEDKKNHNCQNTGKSFKIIGRIKKAEIRGCSDAT